VLVCENFMRNYSDEESQAIQDKAKIFVADERIGNSAGGIKSFLQKHRDKIAFSLRHQNRGRGLTDRQLGYMQEIMRVYDSIVGLNEGYSEEIIERVRDYLESSHCVIDDVDSKNRTFLSKRGIARARRRVVDEGNEYFWNLHIWPTSELVERISRIRNGEGDDAWHTSCYEFRNKLRAGELSAGELDNLVREGEGINQRTFVSTSYDFNQ
jgi:hypothetical protein